MNADTNPSTGASPAPIATITPERAQPPTPARILPTVGRKMWYWPGPQEVRGTNNMHGAIRLSQHQAFDATVLFGFSMHKANITYRDHFGNVFTRMECPVVQEGEEPPTDGKGYAAWMPYQQGKAREERAAT